MIASTVRRRFCCSAMSSRCFCSSRRSVTSSWVATQPPPGIGRLIEWMMRPSLAPTIHLDVSPPATLAMISLQYCAGSPVNNPVSLRCSMSRRSVQPGFTISGESLYIRRYCSIADDDAARLVEHAQALRHVVQRVGQMPDFLAHGRDREGGDDQQRQRNGENGRRPVRLKCRENLGHDLLRAPMLLGVFRSRIAFWLMKTQRAIAAGTRFACTHRRD